MSPDVHRHRGRTIGVAIPASEIPFVVLCVLLIAGALWTWGYLNGLDSNAELAIDARNAAVRQAARGDVYEERLAGKHNLTRPEIRACFLADVDSATAEAIAALDAELVR